MGSAYIRLKFTPIVKYFPKANSNHCWLEIIPTVSSIENFDKIEWNTQKSSVEYVVPMIYKIILKKREPEHQLRMYYSCIDLLSSMSGLDLSAGDVCRCISDNFIVRKAINENKQDFDLKINCKKHDIKVPYEVNEVVNLPVFKEKLTEKENIQAAADNNSKYKSIEKLSILEERRTDTKNKIYKSNNNDRINAFYQANTDNRNKENLQKKLCISKVCKISTADELSCSNYVNTDLIAMPRFNTSVNNIQTKSIQFTKNIYTPFRDTLINSFVRIEPEIRIAQFVQNMENEVFPLKVLLNEIFKKMTTLGLKKNMPSNVSGENKYSSVKLKCNDKTFDVQKEVQSNRVVYSIVFDG